MSSPPPACGVVLPRLTTGARKGQSGRCRAHGRLGEASVTAGAPGPIRTAEPTIFTFLTGRAARPDASARLRRATAALAALVGGVLTWAAAIPAVSAAIIPVPGPGAAYGPAPAAAPAPAPVIRAGMPGWRITSSIAVAVALVAATAAVLLDRARASTGSVPAAR